MINFSRKTRKKLADDNKPLKYARYAIGEIVLVVIGILIALQINNWNEQLKQINLDTLAQNRTDSSKLTSDKTIICGTGAPIENNPDILKKSLIAKNGSPNPNR